MVVESSQIRESNATAAQDSSQFVQSDTSERIESGMKQAFGPVLRRESKKPVKEGNHYDDK